MTERSRHRESGISCPADLDPARRLSPRALEIVAAARTLLERDGWDGLSMRALGDQLGIKAPSLYKHFASKDALRAALAGIALAETGARLHSVISAGGGVAELLNAYRQQAHANPHLYRLATTGPLPRAELPPGLEEWSGTPFFLVAAGDPHLAQALWSTAHGMTILELDQRYPTGEAPSESWRAAARLFDARLGTRPAAPNSDQDSAGGSSPSRTGRRKERS